MPDEAEMLRDLATADAAGDTALATHIAGLIKAGQQTTAPSGLAGTMDAMNEAVTVPEAPDNSDQVSRQRGKALRDGTDVNGPQLEGANFRAAEQKQEAARVKAEKSDVFGAIGRLGESTNPLQYALRVAKVAQTALANVQDNSVIANLRETGKEYTDIHDRIVNSGALYAEKERRAQAGLPTTPNAMNQWLADRVELEWKAGKTPDEERTFVETVGAFVDQVKSDPKESLKAMGNAMLADAPFMFIGGTGAGGALAGAAKAGKTATNVAKAADLMATQAAVQYPLSAAKEYRETGDTKNAGNEALMAAAPVVVLHGAGKGYALAADAAKAVSERMRMALTVGLEKVAEAKGQTLTAGDLATVESAVKAKVATGESPGNATAQLLREFGVTENAATRLGDDLDAMVVREGKESPPPDGGPPVPEGHVRLYRGHKGAWDPLVEPPPGSPMSAYSDRGRWFSSDQGVAKFYAKDDIYYVDVPREKAAEYFAPDGGMYNETGHFLPLEEANKLRRLDGKAVPGAASKEITPAMREVADAMIEAGESPAAVVRFGGKEFDATNHFLGIKQAMDEGLVGKDENGWVKKGPDDTMDLFRLKDGTLIDRNQAGELFGAKRSEEMPGRDGMPEDADMMRQTAAERQLASALRKLTAGQTTENPIRGRAGILKALDAEVAAGRFSGPAADLAKWLIGKNPKVIARLGLTVMDHMRGAAGFYSAAKQVIGLVRSPNAPKDVVTHEILHHSERMMPEHLQRQVGREWLKRAEAEGARAAAAGDAATAQYIQDSIAGVKGDTQARKRAEAMLTNSTIPIDTHYQFFNPTEFWAMNGSELVGKKAGMPPGFGTAAKQWWSGLVEKLKDSAGLKSDAAIIRGLENALKTQGQFKSPGMIREAAKHTMENPSALRQLADHFENTTPKALAGTAMAATAAIAALAETDDLAEVVGAAAIAGSVPFALGGLAKATRGLTRVYKAATARPEFAVKEPLRRAQGAYAAMVQGAKQWANDLRKSMPSEYTSPLQRDAANVRIRDYVQGARDVQLSPKELGVAEAIATFLRDTGEMGLDEGVLRTLREDYLTGLYQKKPFTSWEDVIKAIDAKNFVEGAPGGSQPKTRFARAKVFDDYRTVEDMIATGSIDLIPLTKDPIKIAELYAASLAKAIMIKQIIDGLRHTPGPLSASGKSYTPLVVTHTPAAIATDIARGNALAAKEWEWPDLTKQMQNDIQIRQAPKDYVDFNHPAFAGLRVHKDLVPGLKLIFDTSDPSIILRGAYNVSMASKVAVFSMSLFHAGALGMVSAAVTVPRMLAIAAMTPRLWRTIPGARALLKSDVLKPEAKMAVGDGLNVGGVEDVNVNVVERGLNLAQFYLGDMAEKVGLPRSVGTFTPKAVAEMAKWHHHLIFGELMPTLKLATYLYDYNAAVLRDAQAAAKQQRPPRPLREMGREVADATNTLFGGLNYFELANNIDGKVGRSIAVALFSPGGRRIQQIALMAPDWNIAAIRAWTEGVSALNPFSKKRASDAMYRSYLLWSGLSMLGVGNAIQMARTGVPLWENEDWSKVDLGNGTNMVLNKHFAEAMHMVSNPVQFGINKTNILVREPLNQILGRDFIMYNPSAEKITDRFGGPPMTGSRLAHVAQQFTPISAATLRKDPWAWLSGYAGIPMHGTRIEARVQAVRDKAEELGQSPDVAEAKYRANREKFEEIAAANRAKAQFKDRKSDAAKEAAAAAVERLRARRQTTRDTRGE